MKRDLRKSNPVVQEEVRMIAIRMLKKGEKQKRIAEELSVSARSVNNWAKTYKAEGLVAIRKKTRGRKFGEQRKLTKDQEIEIQKAIVDKTPDQYKMKFVLWTRDAVRKFIKERFGVEYSLNQMSEVLSRWGFTPQKPAKLAYEQNPQSLRKWTQELYPEVAQKAKTEDAEILWCDETCVKPECHNRRSYAPRGQTPVIRQMAKRFHSSLVSAIGARGKMEWMALSQAMNVEQFIRFLEQLIKAHTKKVILIVDNLRVHHAKLVKEWLCSKESRIELVCLPSYSPEINPDEYLNNALKKRLFREKLVKTEPELHAVVHSEMNLIKNDESLVKSFFNHKKVSYIKNGNI